MDPTAVLETMQEWPVEDQIDFAFRVWDRLLEGDWQPEPTDDLKAELDQRLAAYKADPNRVLTWEQVVARVRAGS